MIIKDNKFIFNKEDLSIIPIHPNMKIGIKFSKIGDSIDITINKGKYRVKVDEEVNFYVDCEDIIGAMEMNGLDLSKNNAFTISNNGDNNYYITLPIMIDKKKKHVRTLKNSRQKVEVINNLSEFLTIYKIKLEKERQRRVTYKEIYEEISVVIGLGSETIKKMKENKVNPSIETSFIFCDLFDCELTDLFRRVE